jgi:hypothetical protein
VHRYTRLNPSEFFAIGPAPFRKPRRHAYKKRERGRPPRISEAGASNESGEADRLLWSSSALVLVMEDGLNLHDRDLEAQAIASTTVKAKGLRLWQS